MMVTRTGKKKYRIQKRLFRKDLVVLQFEWVETDRFDEHYIFGMVERNNLPNRYFWKDATIDDLVKYVS